jgi:hypothetical protein
VRVIAAVNCKRVQVGLLWREDAALAYLAREHRDGGVLTRFYLGTIVPAVTGRHTFVGNCYWSEPHCSHLVNITSELFAAQLRPPDARRFVHTSGARFVLADRQSRDLTATLAPITSAVHRFGCASVYVIR